MFFDKLPNDPGAAGGRFGPLFVGEEVVVVVKQNDYMLIKTVHESKPNWYEVVEYDEEGYQLSISYEAIK